MVYLLYKLFVMAKTFIVYGGIYDWTAESIVEKLDSVASDETVKFRINSPGGATSAGISVLNRLSELPKAPEAIIDGRAMSMAAFWLPFFSKVTASDMSRIMFHKAAYPSWYKPSAEEAASLKAENAKFEAKLRKKVQGRPGAEEFLAKVFEADVRNDVELSAQQALQLGLIDEVRTLEPAAELEANYEGFQVLDEKVVVEAKEDTNTLNINSSTMEISREELDKKLREAKAEGIKQENKRCRAWAAFMDVDPEATKKAILDPEAEVDMEVVAEMSMKKVSAEQVQAHQEDNAEEQDEATPAEGDETPEAQAKKEQEEILAMVEAQCKID